MSQVLSDAALEHVLSLSGLSMWTRWFWFRDCVLYKSVILCPDGELVDILTRCFLPQIRQVLPDCHIVSAAPVPADTPRACRAGNAIDGRAQTFDGLIPISPRLVN